MNRMVNGLLVAMGMVVLVGCSSHHHHHGMAGGKSDSYWQKGQQDMEGLVNRTVQDPDKAKAVNALVGEIINELKAGLHTYGFTEGRLLALVSFIAVQFVIVVGFAIASSIVRSRTETSRLV